MIYGAGIGEGRLKAKCKDQRLRSAQTYAVAPRVRHSQEVSDGCYTF